MLCCSSLLSPPCSCLANLVLFFICLNLVPPTGSQCWIRGSSESCSFCRVHLGRIGAPSSETWKIASRQFGNYLFWHCFCCFIEHVLLWFLFNHGHAHWSRCSCPELSFHMLRLHPTFFPRILLICKYATWPLCVVKYPTIFPFF